MLVFGCKVKKNFLYLQINLQKSKEFVYKRHFYVQLVGCMKDAYPIAR